MVHRSFRTASAALLVAGASLASFAACSSDPEEPSGVLEGPSLEYTADSGTPTAGSTGFGGNLNIGPTPGGGSGGSGGICAGVGTAAEPLPVDMYIMLDQSSSMSEPLGQASSKWDATSAAIQSFVNSDRAAGIGVGIQYFGLPDACNPDAYAVPEVAIGRLPAVAPQIASSVQLHGPSTLTPTAPALEGALRYMQTWAAANPQRAAVVVLATDGFPTECGVQCAAPTDCQSGQCENGMCTPNSIGEIEALAKRYAEADPPVLTFVVGVAQGLANLNNIARGGGTGEAYLIDGGNVEEEFLNAMLSISSTPLTCEFDMPTSDDPDSPIDKDKVSVIYTAAATQERTSIPRVNGAGQCSLNQGIGWYYDYDAEPTEIFICPETCKTFRAGSVAIELGCSPVIVPPK